MNLFRRPRRDAASYEKMLRRVRQLAAGKTVLEVGAQTGRVAGRIVADAKHIEAVDPSRAWITGKKRGNDSTKLHYGVQDASSLAFADESFDLAVAVNVLEHAIDPKAALLQLLRVVKSDGTLVAAAFAYADAKGFAKLRRAVQKHTHLSGRYEWTREQFEELLRRCGWEPERVEVLSGSFPFVIAECRKKEA